MDKKTRLAVLKMRENKLAKKPSATEQPGTLKKVRRQLRRMTDAER